MSLPSNNLLLKSLLEFGLSEKEARIYLALLEYDIPTVQEIAKHTGVNRSSAYVVLEALKKRGLVSVSEEGQRTKYIPADPETLLRHAEDISKKQHRIKEKIDAVLPELKAIHKDNKYRPRVQVFEGVEGVRRVYHDIFSTKTDYMKVYANPQNIFRALPDFMDHNTERIKRKIKMYAINPATKENMELIKHFPASSPDEVLLIPEEKFQFSSDMAIHGDKVLLASPNEKFGVIIENREIARMFEANFDLAWQEAKRLNKEYKLPRAGFPEK